MSPIRSALRIMSCFGSNVETEVLLHVRTVCGNSDVVASLDLASKESFLTKKQADDLTLSSYRFNHDVIQNTVYAGIAQEERILMLKELVDTLASRTEQNRSDSILFIIADFIRRIGPENTNKSEDRQKYAQYNLLAGELAVPDYASSIIYFECGISFLDGNCWSNGESYKLSLNLYKNASLSCWVLGNTSLMKKRLDAVMSYAQCYDDKLDSMAVLINSLHMDGKSHDIVVDYAFEALEHLGETFPDKFDGSVIEKELLTVRYLLPSNLNSLPPMVDANKRRAMVSLSVFIMLIRVFIM